MIDDFNFMSLCEGTQFTEYNKWKLCSCYSFFICIYIYISFVSYYNYYVRFWIYIVNTRVWHVHMYTDKLYNVQYTRINVCTMYNVYCTLYNVYIKSSSTRLPIESRDFKIQSSTANCT